MVVRILSMLLAALVLAAAPALAQLSAVQFLDPSIEAAGMGGASIAAFWQESPNDRGNPALMGFHRGIRYSYGDTKLLAEFVPDVHFSSHRILAGACGVGVAIAGKPVDSIGRLRLSYGENEITDINGNALGVYESHEDVRSFAVGISVFDLISSIKGGEPTALSRRASLAIGHTWKTYFADFAPPELAPNGQGEGTQNDAGILLRVAVFDEIGGALRESSDRLRMRIEVAGAYSRLNYLNDHNIEYPDGGTDDVFEQRHVGASTQFTFGLPNGGMGSLQNFAAPAVRLGVAWEQTDLYQDGDKLGDGPNRFGSELSVMDILYLRYGHEGDDFITAEGSTFGVGLQICYRNMVGVKGDWASVPQAAFFNNDLDRYGLTVFVDPYRLMHKGE